jgi:hypothetical protein
MKFLKNSYLSLQKSVCCDNCATDFSKVLITLHGCLVLIFQYLSLTILVVGLQYHFKCTVQRDGSGGN